MKKFISFCLFCLLFSSCVKTIGKEGKYESKYTIYWSLINKDTYTIYTENEVYICSFNGTNYLIEKNNTEELVSTTAPIKLIYCIKNQNEE